MILIFCIVSLYYVPLLYSSQLVIEWNPSEGADGYWLYYGDYPNSYYPAVRVTDTSCSIEVIEGVTYYFSVSAYNYYGESEQSKEYVATVFSIPGDSNFDNMVTRHDFVILRKSFKKTYGDEGYDSRADYNYDQIVDRYDRKIFRQSRRLYLKNKRIERRLRRLSN